MPIKARAAAGSVMAIPYLQPATLTPSVMRKWQNCAPDYFLAHPLSYVPLVGIFFATDDFFVSLLTRHYSSYNNYSCQDEDPSSMDHVRAMALADEKSCSLGFVSDLELFRFFFFFIRLRS